MDGALRATKSPNRSGPPRRPRYGLIGKDEALAHLL